MKRLGLVAIVVLGLLFQQSSIAGQRDKYMSYGVFETSCGTFTSSRGTQRAELEAWVLGFVSGAGYAGPSMAFTDNQGVRVWINTYCSERPIERLLVAATTLTVELQNRAR